jgi:hypothetical protein
MNARTSTLVLATLTAVALFAAGCAAPTSSPVPKDINAIQHTVFIINENHTVDNYFGAFPGADGASLGLLSTGLWILFEIQPKLKGLRCLSWLSTLGISIPHAVSVRNGQRIRHPRHWKKLAQIVGLGREKLFSGRIKR